MSETFFLQQSIKFRKTFLGHNMRIPFDGGEVRCSRMCSIESLFSCIEISQHSSIWLSFSKIDSSSRQTLIRYGLEQQEGIASVFPIRRSLVFSKITHHRSRCLILVDPMKKDSAFAYFATYLLHQYIDFRHRVLIKGIETKHCIKRSILHRINVLQYVGGNRFTFGITLPRELCQ